MGAATIVTLLGVAIIVAAIALYLIIISVTLNHVSYTVGTVIVAAARARVTLRMMKFLHSMEVWWVNAKLVARVARTQYNKGNGFHSVVPPLR